MKREFRELLDGLPLPPEGSFSVVAIPGNVAYFAGRDHAGRATLLIRVEKLRNEVPLRLAGISVNFSVDCKIIEPGQPERLGTFTAVTCLTTERIVESYFASIVEMLIEALGPAPSGAEVFDALDRLVALFQKLRRPSKRPVTGFVGELVVIDSARAPATAISAWRLDNHERYDFCIDELRLEAKATGSGNRAHSVSYEQANPPPGTVGILASIFVEQSSGGTSVTDLIANIERRVGINEKMRLRAVVADTLGQELFSALDWRFDLALAYSSIALFDLRKVPAIRGPLPPSVSNVRFQSDLSGCRPDIFEVFALLSKRAQEILPAKLP